MKYLNEAQLRGFENYKYNSVDTSLLSVYVMHPFWNKCVKYFPEWIAPNVLTFSGFLLTVLNFLLLAYYDFDFKAANRNGSAIPNWVWLVCAINLFVAYTLDGIDGKQARRTSTTGPLGELFDHGLDSFSTAFIPIFMFSLFGLSELSGIRMHFIIWNVFLNFFLPHFEKYNTGVMFLPWGYDFTMWGITLILIFTYFIGASFWIVPIYGNFTKAHICEILLYVSSIASSHPVIAKNIYLSYKKKTGKMRPFNEAMRPIVPFLALFVITTIWMIFSMNQISLEEPRMMFLMFGTIFSNICCRLIVAQMSDTKAELWNWLLWPLMVATVLSCFVGNVSNDAIISLQYEKGTVYALTILATIAHIHYGQGVVREMCDYFKIKCFQFLHEHLLDGFRSAKSELVENGFSYAI